MTASGKNAEKEAWAGAREWEKKVEAGVDIDTSLN